MAKIVRYNGRSISYGGCSNPEKLVTGKEYEVTSVNDSGSLTEYTLKGIEGHYNSVCFDDVNGGKIPFLAVAYNIPHIGENFNCLKINFVDSKVELVECEPEIVNKIDYKGNDIYKVSTYYNTYIVKIIK